MYANWLNMDRLEIDKKLDFQVVMLFALTPAISLSFRN